MRPSTFLAPLFFATTGFAQAVAEGIAPASSPPSGCEETINGKFAIGTLDVSALKHKRETAQEASDGDLLCTLKDGILHDHSNRTGSIVANHQFQFDGPPQAGAIYTGGFSVCKNDSLAIGGTTRWWRCASGSFVNLYDESIGGQCIEIRIQAIFDSTSSSSSTASVSTIASASGASASGSAASSASRSGSTASTSGSSSVVTAFSTASAFAQSTSATASRSGSASGSSASASSSSAATAPSAGGAALSLNIAKTVALGAIMIFVGAAMVL